MVSVGCLKQFSCHEALFEPLQAYEQNRGIASRHIPGHIRVATGSYKIPKL